MCLPGLGGTKASFMNTVAALADTHRVIAIDLPGFGDSVKPIRAAYDAPWFARTVIATLDALDLDRVHLIGNSMGGRVALETALRHPDRVERVVGLAPAVAWLSERRWAPLLKLIRPELGLLQPAPRAVVNRIVRGVVPGAREGWVAAGVDEFLRAYLTPRGRAAFYACARNIYLDEPHGDKGFWTRLARHGARGPVRVGQAGHAGADRLRTPREGVPAVVVARRAQLRPRAAGGGAGADAPGRAEVPARAASAA